MPENKEPKQRPHTISWKGRTRITKQSFKDECDINLIMARHARTGEITHLNGAQPHYGDFTNAQTYLDAQQSLIIANEAFASLPSEVRERFGNDPASLLNFLDQAENHDEAVELGLLPKPEAAKSPPAEAGSSSPPPAEIPQGEKPPGDTPT